VRFLDHTDACRLSHISAADCQQEVQPKAHGRESKALANVAEGRESVRFLDLRSKSQWSSEACDSTQEGLQNCRSSYTSPAESETGARRKSVWSERRRESQWTVSDWMEGTSVRDSRTSWMPDFTHSSPLTAEKLDPEQTGIPIDMWPVWMLNTEVDERRSSGTETDLQVEMRQQEMMAKGVSLRNSIMRKTLKSPKDDGVMRNAESFLQCLIIHPASKGVGIWCVLGAILLTYDMLVIPLQAFPIKERSWMKVVSLGVSAYWSVDLLRQFFTGYETADGVEMRPRQVAKKYLRTLFALDFATCVVDWATHIMEGGGKINKFWRAGRAIQAWKIIHPARFVRIVKLYRSTTEVMKRCLSVQAWIAFKSLNLVSTIIFACHSMACYWYFVGNVFRGAQMRDTWLFKQGLLQETSVGKLYSICFHWSMAQSGLLSSDVYPTNSLERMFACFTAFIWLMIIGVAINSFNSWATQLRLMHADREKQDELIGRYLEDHKASKWLTYEVLRSFRMNFAVHRPRVHKEEVAFLQDLPVRLQIALHTEVYLPLLKTHSFFRFLGSVSVGLLQLISYLAVHESHVWCGETIFSEGTPASHMIQVTSGQMEYFAVHHGNRCTLLSKGEWACEPALWLKWLCQGRMIAVSSGEFMFVTVETFHAIIKDAKVNGKNIAAIQEYSMRVCEHFLTTCPKDDLWRPVEDMDTLADAVCLTKAKSNGAASSTGRSATWLRSSIFGASSPLTVLGRLSGRAAASRGVALQRTLLLSRG